MSEVKVVLRLENGQYVADLQATGQQHQAFSAQVSSSSATASTSLGKVTNELQAVGAASTNATAAATALDLAAQSATSAGAAVGSIPRQLQGVAAQFTAAQGGLAGVSRQAGVTQASLTGATTAAQGLGTTLQTTGTQATRAGNETTAAADRAAAALRRAEQQARSSGVSAAQTAAALRNVPAQITDIVVGLQGGQAPLTVLLQQGGQLKDMFGGVVPAARALSGALLGMVNPYTLVAAAAGVLAIGYKLGSQEADNYRLAIVMSGNAAGTTVGQMGDMARAIAATGSTQAAASSGLAEMASMGRVSADNLQYFTSVALGLEKYAGVPIKATVAAMEELGKAPLQASQKLDEQYRYLTTTIYSQIKALDEQGRKEEAAALAQKSFATAMEARKNELVANLGSIERGWLAVTGAAKRGWDAILNVGRADTTQQKLDAVGKRLQELRDAEARGGFAVNGNNAVTGAPNAEAAARRKAEILTLEQQQAALQESVRLEKRGAEAKAESNRQREAQNDWEKILEANRTKERRDELEIQKIREAGKAYGVDPAAIQKQVDAYKARTADKGAGTASAALAREIGELEKLQTEATGIAARAAAQLEAQHKAGLVSDAAYYAQKRDLALQANTDQQAIVELEIAAVDASKGSAAEKARARAQYGKELATLVEQELTIQTTYEDQVLQLEARMVAKRLELRRQESAGIDQWMAEQQAAHSQNLASIEKRTESLADEQRAMDVAARLNISLAEAIELVTIARLEEQRNAKFYEGSDGWNQATQEIEARRRLAAQIGGTEARDAARRAGVEAQRELQRATDQYTEGLINAAAQGGDSLEKYVTNLIKRRAWEIVLTPVMSGLGGIMATIMGTGGSGGRSGSSLVSLASNASTLNTAYGAATQWMTGATAGASSLSLGAANAAQMMGGDAIGTLISANGAWAGVSTAATGLSSAAADAAIAMNLAAEAGTGVALAAGTLEAFTAGVAAMEAAGMIPGVAAAVEGGVAAGAATGVMGSITSALSSIPVWGWIAGAVMLVGSALSKKPTPHSGGAVYSDPLLTTAVNPDDKGPVGFSSYVDKDTLAQVKTVVTNTQTGLNAVLRMGTGTSPLAVLGGFADDKSKDGAWGQLIIKKLDATVEDALVNWESTRTEKWAPAVFADGEAGFKEWQNRVAKDSVEALKAVSSELPAWTNRMIAAANVTGDNAAEAFQELVTKIGEYPSKLLEVIGTSSQDLAAQLRKDLEASDPAAAGANFANAIVGGIEGALVGNLSTNITNAVTQGMVTPFLDSLLTGATASEALAAMSTQQTLERVRAQATAFREIWGNADFQAVLAELRTTISSTVSAGASAAAYVPRYTQAMLDNTKATKDATDAQREAEAAAKRIADERKGLQDQLDELTMTRVQLLEKERNAVDASNRALWDAVRAAQTHKDLLAQLPALYEKFRTPEERKAASYQGISDNLAAAGIRISPEALLGATKAQIAGVVMEINAMGDTSDETRLALVAAAMGLADLMDQAQSVADQAAQGALASLSRSIDAEKTAVSEAAEARIDALRKEADAQKLAQEAATESLADVTRITEQLTRAVATLRGQVESTKLQDLAAARRFIADAVITAQATGVLPDAEALERAIASVTADDQQRYATAIDWEIAQLDQANQLAALEQLGAKQKSIAEQHLEATKDQADLLQAQIETVQQETNRTIKALDAQYKLAEQQLQTAQGMDTSLKSIDAATATFAASLAQLAGTVAAARVSPAAVPTGAAPATAGVLNGPNGAQYDGRSDVFYAGNTGLPYFGADLGQAAIALVQAGRADELYQLASANGVTAQMLGQWTNVDPAIIDAWATANGVAKLDTGTNYVPKDMLAMLHEGERVVPKRYNPDANPGMWAGAQTISARLQQSANGAAGEAAVSSVITTLGRSVEQLGAGIGTLVSVSEQTRDATRRVRDVQEAVARGEISYSVTTS
jgi:phage-related minor tail protein